jgi:Transposase IS66 family
LKRWAAFARFLDDGRIRRTNAAAERAVRGIAIGLGSWTFAGSDAGGQGAAVVPKPIETCELNDADPPAWLAHVLAKPRDRPAKRRDEWPPWKWTPRHGADRMDPTDSGIANWMLRARTLVRPYGASPSKAVTLVPRRKGRPVLTQIRKNHRIVGADNLGPHKHVAIEPDLAREVSGQCVGEFVVMGLVRHAMNSQGFVA